ncbi:hypothetical protein [Fuerstiella marisgermanici]|uniref:Cell division protein FtsQ n=1 Tax=Fuerstiella marisgermanici TaxID=1891926 RepID=A0A1P8WK24_9PLAN|nr:hypothetical protein [Fuerstiella marisgermanici]APZ94386.1 hypothetical protein Fuma_04018 [Fuerstiella marisgermanici]
MARTVSKKKKALPLGQRIVRWVFRPMRLVCAAALAMLWLCWPMVERQLPQLDNRDEYRIGVDQVVVTPPPRWVPEDIVAKVFARAGFDESLSLLDSDLSERVALAFYTYPWVERLKQVRKSFPARVYVEVVYREPVAMVEVVGGGYLPVDRHGHLLPEKDFSAADIDRYPVIKNVSTAPIGYHGESWGDPAVAGAAQLAAVLTAPNAAGQSWWNSLGLKTIFAPRRLAADDNIDDLQFELGTSGGSRIAWGRPPQSQHPGELTVAQKLERMAEYHRSQNGFDDGPARYLIDIRDWETTRRHLLAAEPPKTSRR